MKNVFLTLFLLFAINLVQAQNTNNGKVNINHDSNVQNIVNNRNTNNGTNAAQPSASTSTSAPKANTGTSQAKSTPKATIQPKKKTNGTYKQRQRYNAKGYRIQIYTGGNSRKDKQEAQRRQQKCKTAFPELSTYVHFVSPHWVCRVGDFLKKEDAQRYIKKLNAKKLSNEARIVQSNIFIAR